MNKLYDKMIKNDEAYTTRAESDKLVNYLIDNKLLPKEKIIWLPFDNELSNIYLSFKHLWGGQIILTNLEMGINFYHCEPDKYDIIISNPPFSNRTDLFNRLHQLDKPFIILNSTQLFNNQHCIQFLCDFSSDYQFIMPRTRMSFMRLNKDEKTGQEIVSNTRYGAAFYSFWIAYKMKMKQTFNKLNDNGREREIETFDVEGNPIVSKHLSLFNYQTKEDSK